MVYFEYEDGTWEVGNEVHFPNGVKLNPSNKGSKDGWTWHDNPPQQFINWLSNLPDDVTEEVLRHMPNIPNLPELPLQAGGSN